IIELGCAVRPVLPHFGRWPTWPERLSRVEKRRPELQGLDVQAEKQTFIHWRRGSRRGSGIGSCHRLADRQPQARQEQFAVLGITQVTGVRYYGRGNGAHLPNNFSCVIKPAHLRVAGSEKAIWVREARIFLDRDEEFRHRLLEAPADEVCHTYVEKRRSDAGAGTE